jgi:hypothetical protein
MKHLKLFEGYQSESEVAKICEKFGIEDWTLNENGLVDVCYDVDLNYEGLTSLPLKFGKVDGWFTCDGNKLKSLKGSPHTVGGYFSCNDNLLKTLEGSPLTLDGGDFFCRDNNIYSFEGFPRIINTSEWFGDFNCFNNPIYNVWILLTENYKIDYQIIELLNDYDVFRNDDTEQWPSSSSIILDRFNDFLQDIGKDPVKSVTGYKNI